MKVFRGHVFGNVSVREVFMDNMIGESVSVFNSFHTGIYQVRSQVHEFFADDRSPK